MDWKIYLLKGRKTIFLLMDSKCNDVLLICPTGGKKRRKIHPNHHKTNITVRRGVNHKIEMKTLGVCVDSGNEKEKKKRRKKHSKL